MLIGQMSKSQPEKRQLSVQIADLLEAEISRCVAGEKLPTIAELAKRYEVSVLTIREALSALTSRGVVVRRRGSGTYVADITRSRHVGVLCESDISDPRASYFYHRVPQQLVRFFQRAGFPVRLYVGHVPMAEPPHSELTSREFLEALERRQLSGAVVIDEPIGSQWLESLQRQHIPIIGLQEWFEYACVRNKAQMGRLGAEYLIRHGRRRIALIQWLQPQPPGTPQRNPVMKGFRETLAAAGVEIQLRWIRHDLPPGAPGAGWEEFREIWVSKEEKPDGLLVCDDMLFLGTAMAICQLGIRVPEDLLVVTHWNKGSGLISPFPVAKVAFDLDDYVRKMGAMLVQLMRHEPVENHRVVLPCELLEPGEKDGDGDAVNRAPTYEDGTDTETRRHGDMAGVERGMISTTF